MSKKLKHGFTLVELVVVTMLMGVIMTAIVMIVRPTQKHYNNLTNRAQEENACIQATDVIDGELRYATAIKIVYSDKNGRTRAGTDVWSTVDAEKYPNYFRITNNEREMIGSFQARGYAEKGMTGSHATVGSLISRNLFNDFDYQFSISGINTAAGQQSITLQIDATPMLATANNVIRDGDRTHTFSETFKLINLRNKGKIGASVIGLGLPVDNLSDYVNEGADEYGEIYIFYAVPRDVASTGGTQLGGNHIVDGLGDDGAYDPKVPLIDVEDAGASSRGEVVFVAGTEYSGDYKMTIVDPDGAGNTATDPYDPATVKTGDGTTLQAPCGKFSKVRFPANSGELKLETTNGHAMNMDTIPSTIFSTYPVVYVYDYGWYTTDPALPPDDAHTTIVHYLYSIGEPYEGVNFTNATSDPHTVKVDGNRPGFVQCTSDRDIQVVVYDAESHVDLYAGASGSTTESPLLYTIDSNSPAEIWIYNGAIYTESNSIPARVAPITFHYMSDIYDQKHGFSMTAEPDRNAIATSANGGSAYLGTTPTVFSGNGNFDVSVNLNQNVRLYLFDTVDGNAVASMGSVNWDATVREYWIYNGTLTEYQPEVFVYQHDVVMHYIQSSDPNDCGLRLYDLDLIPESSTINNGGVGSIPDRSSTSAEAWDNTCATINATSDHTLHLMHFESAVGIMGQGMYGGTNIFYIVNSATPSEIWIYKQNVYTSYADVEARMQPGVLSLGYDVTGDSINIHFQAVGGDVTETRVVLYMNNPISAIYWVGLTAGNASEVTCESYSDNMIIIKVAGVLEGNSGNIQVKIPTNEMNVGSIGLL